MASAIATLSEQTNELTTVWCGHRGQRTMFPDTFMADAVHPERYVRRGAFWFLTNYVVRLIHNAQGHDRRTELVTEGIDSVKTIAEAVKSGKDYIEAKHPEVRSDLRLMVDELQKSLLLIKRASAVLTNFRFAIYADVQGSELVRFNDYFIQSKTEAQHLENHIDDLRTHCSKIRKHGTKIGGEATVAGFTKVFHTLVF